MGLIKVDKNLMTSTETKWPPVDYESWQKEINKYTIESYQQ